MTEKVAISLPDDLYRQLEAARTRARLSRSAAIQAAISAWLDESSRDRAAAQYVEGYRRVPEQVESVAAWTGAEAWGEWEGE